MALSVDDEAATRDLIARHGLRFPVGHSADAVAVADATGAFVNPGPPFLQSTGFVLDPDGRVILSVYSSGAIGRLVPQDVIGLIGYLRGTQLSRQEAPHGTGYRITRTSPAGRISSALLKTPKPDWERPA